jgi:UDP-GlcNAc:undecaprenyl-phosphate/decaprenyl-phosphate GlcNAc-1-phosphate transferase
VAAVVTFLLTFVVRAVATRRKLIVLPDAERVHTVPTPTAGGTSMFIAFGITMAVARLVPSLGFHVVFGSNEPLGVIIAAGAMFIVGFVDDIREVSAPAKVAGQVIAAMILYFAGVTILHFKVPFAGYLILSPSILPLVTALWVIGIANAVNLIDGLDGLAAGVVAIASGTLCVYGLRLENLQYLPVDNVGPLVAAATCGLCIGFLPHNFHRAKIFMGDTGAMVLGVLMAASTMVIGGGAYQEWGQTYVFFVPLFVPFVILGVPILDTAFAIIRRTVRRTSFAVRDLEHLHHRLMRLGHGHRRTVVVLWTWTFLLSALVLYGVFNRSWSGAIPIGLLVLAVGLYTLFQPGLRSEPAAVADSAASPITAMSAAALGPTAAAAGGAADASGDTAGTFVLTARAAPVGPRDTRDAVKGAGRTEAPSGAHRAQHRRRFARHDPPTRG